MCKRCKKKVQLSKSLPYCADCIRAYYDDLCEEISRVHAVSRREFGLPEKIPRGGHLECRFCVNHCRIGKGERGYCGISMEQNDRLYYKAGTKNGAFVKWYYDGLPTNCVADWVCAGCTGAGFPHYAHNKGPESGFKNLAVFYEACNFNCLFCQNWQYKYRSMHARGFSSAELARAADKRTSCICFFGGDPAPQIIHSIETCRIIKAAATDGIFRFCWETNGAMNQSILKVAADLAFESGGCIKVDFKAWDENLHRALTGSDNSQTKKNIKFLASYIQDRQEPPFLVVSTLLVPGYIDTEEIYQIASFLASLNKNIPYCLLAFYPQFYMNDLPTTSRALAEQCAAAAQQAGLTNIKVGNMHLLR